MSIATAHNEWLSLVDISGPFLSLKVLTDTFPQGLPVVASAMRSDVRAAYEEWADNQSGFQPEEAMHRAWFEFVFADLLGYQPQVFVPCGADCPPEWQAALVERQITLRPDFALRHAKEEKPRLLVMTLPSQQGLEKRSKEAYTAANEMTPATQMLELLRATGVPLGLVSNGAEWMLVYTVPGETASYATWKTELWLDEPVTLNAFYTLLELGRFFGVPDEERLPALLAASKDNQHDVTDQLGIQVRHAVEILVQAIARADMDQQGRLLADIDEQTIYEAGLVVMMRLVFLLSAEEQGLLLLGDPIYDQNYAVSTLRAQLREAADQVGEEVIQRRTDAWARLLATFRAVYSGVWHEQLGLPAYGGALFDPDRFPFLEGRTGAEAPGAPITPLQLDNRTVLHLLQALQQLELRAGGVTTLRTLSFRALGVEQIGHVYEGLLDHRAVRATEVVLGLDGAAGLEPEISLAALEAEAAKGHKALLAYLEAETKRSKSALERALGGELSDLRHGRFLTACGGDEHLLARVLPFAGLVRDDTRDEPLVILPGEVYVTAGQTRRQTGSHYTPRSLTEPIVQHTLEPLVYVGPAEGLAREAWRLRPAAELLALKVCDMAMGSGAFLVQACRYLAERLLEAWEAEDAAVGAEPTANRPFAGAFGGQNLDELYTLAKRLVAERCLYGVDKNPLAVEMAKLSLWLVTLSKNKAFTFLDHALRHGDSLIGIDEDTFYRWSHTDKTPRGTLLDEENRRILAEVKELRQQIQGMAVLDVRDAQEKERLLAEADAKKERLIQSANFLVGLELLDWKSPQLKPYDKDAVKLEALIAFQAGNDFSAVGKAAVKAAKTHDAFHWHFEFPEVFARGGFSAFVGNPPFMGGRNISGTYGGNYFQYLRNIYPSTHGQADYCVFFFLTGYKNLAVDGALGLIATNTIYQGDTRESGLDYIVSIGGSIYEANPEVQWPGNASVSVSVVHVKKGEFNGRKRLNGVVVNRITTMLDDQIDMSKTFNLLANVNFAFKGSEPGNSGFILTPSEALKLLAKNTKYKDVLFPYINGRELNATPGQTVEKWVIYFGDMALREAKVYADCFQIVEENVYPERKNSKSSQYRNYWWKFRRTTRPLYETSASLSSVLAVTQVSKFHGFVFLSTEMVFDQRLIIFAFDDYQHFALLQSSIHLEWVLQNGSTLETRPVYTPSDCFETFPFPLQLATLETVGKLCYEHRQKTMNNRQEGLTATYNRFHDPAETAQDIAHLRRLHVEMDNAVAAAYGWQDLPLGHGFHETAQGLRYTISESARREVLTRLLQLNHQRYAEEVAAGLHEKGKKAAPKNMATKGKKSSKKNDGQLSMF